MPYVTYNTHQLSFGRPKDTSWRDIGSFRPTWLIKASNMQVVPGTEAKYGYCAFSYSWSYSGDIITEGNGKSKFVDKGSHKIIKHNWNVLQKNCYTTTTLTVKFEKVIQQICEDFGIDYIWYDKKCIDQNDPVKKINEIKQMHNIYKNALFTVVLIPELKPEIGEKNDKNKIKKDPFDDYYLKAIIGSEWYTRMWTLEESLLSRNLVFVGETMHFWSHQLGSDLFYYGKSIIHKTYYPIILELCYDNRADASKVLHFAHCRTSDKVHDKVFALANIFPDTFKTLTVNYHQDLEEALLQFYRRLAEDDITIIYFGRPAIEYPSTMKQFEFLPSWVGINGMHVLKVGLEHLQSTTASSFSVATTTSAVSRQVSLEERAKEIFSSTVVDRSLIIECSSLKLIPSLIQLLLDHDDDNKTKILVSVEHFARHFGLKITHYAPATTLPKESRIDNKQENSKQTQQYPSLRKEDFHPSAFLSLVEGYAIEECHILNIPFNVYRRFGIFHPVVQWNKKQQSYNAIGVFIIHITSPYPTIKVPLDRFGILETGKFKIQ